MRVVHLLRKYDPAEWGGTETAVQRLSDGLHQLGISPIMYCPRLNGGGGSRDRDGKNGFPIKRFKACVPVWGISRQQKRQFVAVGGNLMSFDLLAKLWWEREATLIHSHTMGRLGSIASIVAQARRLPFVLSIHGGLFDLPATVKNGFNQTARRGIDWGRLFGMLLRSRHLLSRADAILTCNPREAELVRARYPHQRVQLLPNGIPFAVYQEDHQVVAREAFPQIRDRQVILCVGRIDPVKNQRWLVEQASKVFAQHPNALLVFAGASTDQDYSHVLQQRIQKLGLAERILFTGGLPGNDPRLLGLFRAAQVVVLPSVSETFGLVLLEAWASGTPVISSRTSGASSLVKQGENGWLFDLETPSMFHEALAVTLQNLELRMQLARAGAELVRAEYDVVSVASRVKKLYEQLIEEKHALRHSA